MGSVRVLLCGMAIAAGAALGNTVQLNFAAANQSPWSSGGSVSLDQSINIPDPFLHGSLNLGKFDTDPAGAVLSFLGGIVHLPIDQLGSVTLSPTASFTAGLTAGYHVDGGQLNLNYPQQVRLNMPGQVTAGQPFTVSATFPDNQLSLDNVNVSVPAITALAGAGYQMVSRYVQASETQFTPTAGFSTTFPYAKANVDLDLQAQGNIQAKACILFVACGSGDISLGSVDLSQQILEASTLDGIKVLDHPFVQFGQPYDLNGWSTLTVNAPNLSVNGTLKSDGTMRGNGSQPILNAAFDAEQLLPLVGEVLHGDVGGIGYELLSLQPGLALGIYQKLSFDPTAIDVDLQFNQPMLYNGAVTKDVKFEVGQTVTLTPPVGQLGIGDLTVKPTFTLRDTFSNETGLFLSGTLHGEALALLDPFNVGPAFQTSPDLDLGTIEFPPLYDNSFEVNIPPITTGTIDVSRVGNLSLALTAHTTGLTEPDGSPQYRLFIGNDFYGTGRVIQVTPPDSAGGFFLGCNYNDVEPVCDTVFLADQDIFYQGQDLGTLFCLDCSVGSTFFNPTSPLLSGDFGDLYLSDLSSFPGIPTPNDIRASDPILANTTYFQQLSLSQPGPVPEPGTLFPIGLGLVAMLCAALRRSLAPQSIQRVGLRSPVRRPDHGKQSRHGQQC